MQNDDLDEIEYLKNKFFTQKFNSLLDSLQWLCFILPLITGYLVYSIKLNVALQPLLIWTGVNLFCIGCLALLIWKTESQIYFAPTIRKKFNLINILLLFISLSYAYFEITFCNFSIMMDTPEKWFNIQFAFLALMGLSLAFFADFFISYLAFNIVIGLALAYLFFKHPLENFNSTSYLLMVINLGCGYIAYLKSETIQSMLYSKLYHENVADSLRQDKMELLTAVDSARSDEFMNWRLAHTDALTGLANRRYLMEKIQEAFDSKEDIALLYLDLDGFKKVNDTLGHETGDKLLIFVANKLKDSVKKSDTVCRQGGDEFIVLLRNVSNAEQILAVVRRILDIFKYTLLLEKQKINVSTSIGISLKHRDTDIQIAEFIKQADVAMYVVKKAGKNSFKFYEQLNQNELNTGTVDLELKKEQESKTLSFTKD